MLKHVRYPLATSSWDDAELRAMQEVIATGNFTMGVRVREFEKAFAKWLGVRFCVMVNSGSSANLAAIAAMQYVKERPLRRGDEVIVPAVSWSTSFFPLAQYGLKLKFVDIDLDTLNYDLEALSNAVSPQTRMIVAVNLLGNPNNFAVIRDIIGNRPVILMEDNCESMGAEYQGRNAGTFGRVGTFSFFFSHHISTMEGGMVATDDEELYEVLLATRAHGWTRNLPFPNSICEKSSDVFYDSFRFVVPGYNLRPLEISGAIGVEQLKKFPRFLVARRKNAELCHQLLGHFTGIRLQKEIGSSSWFGFSFVLTEQAKCDRKQVVQLLRERDIECRPIVAGNFVRNEAIRYFDYEVHGELKNADRVHYNGFFVGNHHYDLSAELRHLARALDEVL